MPETAFLITTFATLFVVIDPPGLVPLFIALTQGMDNARRAAMVGALVTDQQAEQQRAEHIQKQGQIDRHARQQPELIDQGKCTHNTPRTAADML